MLSLTQVPPQPFHLDLGCTYGALFIGCILAALLFGLTNIQAFIYFRTHTGKWTKFYRFIVLLLWTLDGLHLALTIHCVYFYLVTNFANFNALNEIVWSFKLQVVVNILIVHMIHLLYSHRIWIVGRARSKIFRIIPGIVIALSLGVGIALIWIVYCYKPTAGLYLNRWPSIMAMSTATVLDIVITLSLWYLLANSRTGFSDTDCLITRLMSYTINSGCLTSMCALVSIILSTVTPHNFVFFSIQFITAKLYVNSYIALLNTRYYTQPDADIIDSIELRREPPSPGLRMSQEKFPLFRRSLLAHPDVKVVPPTQPLAAVMSRRSILVTVEKESFIDL